MNHMPMYVSILLEECEALVMAYLNGKSDALDRIPSSGRMDTSTSGPEVAMRRRKYIRE